MSGETGVLTEGEAGLWATADDAPGAKANIEFGDCDSGELRLTIDGVAAEARKNSFVVTETRFRGVDGERAGHLVMPENGEAKAIVVIVHGSEKWSAVQGERLQTLLPHYGIAVFVYDKRGTGGSEGKYTQDFDILAGDAMAAAAEARQLFGGNPPPVGYWGGSQGGWIAPLAALGGGADFVIAAYGLAESPLAEDREEVFGGLREAGHGEDVIAKAREITDATGKVMASDFKDGFVKDGFEELAAVKKKYKGEAWVKDVDGEFSGDFMRAPNFALRIIGPFFGVGTSWEYEPRPTLEALEMPHLWIVAEKDREAPSEKTLAILREVQKARPNLDIVLFPDTDHGIWQFVEKDGERVSTRFAPGYLTLIRDFILTYEPTVDVEGPVVYRGERAP
jgi:pimeloyl-ACP methyl ester carboxylesterase